MIHSEMNVVLVFYKNCKYSVIVIEMSIFIEVMPLRVLDQDCRLKSLFEKYIILVKRGNY